MLPFYAERFSTTEINYTFHRIPAPKTIDNWKAQTPEEFRFALKAPQKITHWSKLKDCADTLEYFCKVVTGLGDRLGPILFQLPPTFKKDADCLSSFLREFPDMRGAFEFRHDSWFDDEIFELLKSRNISLCIADTDDLATPKEITADYGYLRLRRVDYTEADVKRWSDFEDPSGGEGTRSNRRGATALRREQSARGTRKNPGPAVKPALAFRWAPSKKQNPARAHAF